MQFKQHLQHALSKLKDPSTVSTANEEIESLLTLNNGMSDQERMSYLLYHINEEFNETMKPVLKRELIRLIGKAAEIFQEAF